MAYETHKKDSGNYHSAAYARTSQKELQYHGKYQSMTHEM